MTRQATVRFTLEVGRLVAGQVERAVRQAAFQENLDIDIEKHMGLLDGVLLVVIKGDADKAIRLGKSIERWANEN